MSESDLDIDALLDSTLDDLEDLPSFTPFRPGAHSCRLTLGKKTISGHPTVEATFTLIETMELADSQDEADKEGDSCSSAFFLDNEIGRGKFKALAKVLGEALGTVHNGEIVEQTTDMEVVLLSSIRLDKNDKTKEYLNIIEITVV